MATNSSGSSANRPGSTSNPGGAGTGGGNPAPSGPSLVGTTIAGVKSAYEAVKALFGPPLTKDTRKHVARVRRKVEQYVGRVIGLLADFPALCPQGRTPQELIDKQTLFDALGPLLNVLNGFRTEVGDTMMELESDLYTTALSICTIAEQSKAPDQTVMQVVGDMRKALAYGPRVKHTVTKTPVEKTPKRPKGTAASPATPAAEPAGNGGSAPAPAPASVSGSPAPAPAPTGK